MFAALPFDVDDHSVIIGGTNIPNIGSAQFISAKASEQSCQNEGEISLSPVGLAGRSGIRSTVSNSAPTAERGRAFGNALASFGRPTRDIGLASSSSAV